MFECIIIIDGELLKFLYAERHKGLIMKPTNCEPEERISTRDKTAR